MSSIDKKPKYEPSPMPDFTAASSWEEAMQMFQQYQQTENERIADWWPRENEGRLARLEAFAPLVGTWPIVDYSYVLVNLTQQNAECSPVTATYDQSFDYEIAETDFETGINLIRYSESGDYLYGCSQGTGGKGNGIYQFALTTPYDISTMSYFGFYSISPSTSSAPKGLGFKTDGTKMYYYRSTYSGNPAVVLQYGLSTAWDITTASLENSVNVNSVNPSGYSMVFAWNGEHFYISENDTSETIDQYDLSTAWDITTASYSKSKVISDIPKPVSPVFLRTFTIDKSGKNFLADSYFGAEVNVLTMSTPYDISTCSYNNTIGVNQTSNPLGGDWSGGCTYMLLADPGAREFDGYEIG